MSSNTGKNKKPLYLAAIIVIIIIIITLFFTLRKKESKTEITQTGTTATTTTQTTTAAPVLADMPIDFETWQAYNPEVYAWIYIPNTSVNYPIFQSASDDDNYYLDRNVDGSTGYPGSIHSEKINSKDFSDHHTVLYGHNMRAGFKFKSLDATMFRTLHKFEDSQFFNENRYFYIYTPSEVLTYEIFAAYTFSNCHLLKSYDWQSDEGFSSYLDIVYSQKGNIRTDAEKVTASDSIVSMETCTGNSKTRLIVAGVLRKREDAGYVELPDDNPLKKNMLLSSYIE